MTVETFDLVHSPLEGRNLVEASAGTGKTFTLAALFVRLLVEGRLTVDQILVVTFTEAATEELRGRIRERLWGALEAFRTGQSDDDFLGRLLAKIPARQEALLRIVEALRYFDEAPVFTIHGFCQRVLQEKAFECGTPFDAELVVDERPLIRGVADDFWRKEIFGASPALIAHAQRRGVSPATLADLLTRKAKAANLQVLPGTDTDSDGTSAVTGELCRAALETPRRLWPAAREEVGALLANDPALNRSSYRTTSVPNWLLAMDLYLDSSDPLACFEAFRKFCTATLRIATKKGQRPPDHPFFDACQTLQDLREVLETDLDRQLLNLQARWIVHARSALARRKAEQNVRSFDDLLRDLRDALEGRSGPRLAGTLRDRYRAALIDEFQDTDPVQYAIFRAIFPDPSCRLFLIGDPKQAIYGFRGADVFAYIHAVTHADRHWTLGLNWRSTPNLIDAVNAIFANTAEPFVFREIPFHPVAPAPKEVRKSLCLDGLDDRSPLQLWFVPREGNKPIGIGEAARVLPAAVAGEILRLLEAGAEGRATLEGRPVEPGDIAVLVRSNRQARQIKTALDALGIPGVLYGSESLFAAPEADDLLRVLGAAADPRNDRLLRAALVTDLLGLGGDDLARMASDEAEWDGRLQRFARYRDLWGDRGFVVMARALLADERVRERLLPLPDGERRLTNVLHLIEVLQRAAVEEKLGPEGLVQWLGRRLEERSDAEEYQVRLETDERALKVVTVHKSKGLEYPIVFCPFAWGGSREKDGPVLFHDPEVPLRVVLDLGSERMAENRRFAEEEALAESSRLLYVALTRAQNRCHVVWGAFKEAESSALAHLLHPAPAGNSRDPGRVAGLTDAEMEAELETLSRKTAGAIQVTALPLPAPPGARYVRAVDPAEALSLRAFGGRIPAEWGVASFSSLVSGRDEAAEFPDRDEWTPGGAPSSQEAGANPDALTFFDFPRGTRAGNCLHAILEAMDYAADLPGKEVLVRSMLGLHGFDAGWAGPVTDGLDRVLRAPLDPQDPSLTLSGVAREDRVNELEFYLPAGLLTPHGLARVFAGHRGPTVPDALIEALEGLGFRPSRGFLKGFVDLVFQAGGRYFIVDWKSNHLGARIGDYGPEALQRAVDDHLYGLQYHLYAAALHRHLSTRLPDYDYDQHFGGVFYLFLRGVEPTAPGSGVHRARPTRALVEALCAYLAGEEGP